MNRESQQIVSSVRSSLDKVSAAKGDKYAEECLREVLSALRKKKKPKRKRAESKGKGLSAKAKKAYIARNKILESLGYTSYEDYLNSSLWKLIRVQVLLACHSCYGCSRRATQVHHQKYTKENLSGARFRHMVGICHKCHNEIEYSDSGKKLSPDEANKRLAAIREAAGV